MKHKIGDMVYLKCISLSGNDNFIPSNLVNKPLKILEITKIPLSNRDNLYRFVFRRL